MHDQQGQQQPTFPGATPFHQGIEKVHVAGLVIGLCRADATPSDLERLAMLCFDAGGLFLKACEEAEEARLASAPAQKNGTEG